MDHQSETDVWGVRKERGGELVFNSKRQRILVYVCVCMCVCSNLKDRDNNTRVPLVSTTTSAGFFKINFIKPQVLAVQSSQDVEINNCPLKKIR